MLNFEQSEKMEAAIGIMNKLGEIENPSSNQRRIRRGIEMVVGALDELVADFKNTVKSQSTVDKLRSFISTEETMERILKARKILADLHNSLIKNPQSDHQPSNKAVLFWKRFNYARSSLEGILKQSSASS